MAFVGVPVPGVIVMNVRAGVRMGVLAGAVAMPLTVERFVSERRCVWHLLQG
jgi:hypothetical protein